MSYNSKDVFESLKENSKYVRVDESHPLELYLGLDSHGNKTIRLNESFVPKNGIKSSAQITIQQVKFPTHNSILFSNTGEDDIFYQFCNDLIDTSRNCKIGCGYQFLLNRYTKWKKMFSSDKKALDEKQIKGLLGELVFLKEFAFEKYGIRDAIIGWSGTEPTHKDFSYGDEWFEIKTINDGKSTISISSIEQLDSISNGKLVIYELQKMSPTFNGLSLNNFIAQIKEQIIDEDTLDILENKLLQAGYIYSLSYDDFVFCLMGNNVYDVNENFPRIKRENIPSEIVSVKYEIFISSIEKFIVKL